MLDQVFVSGDHFLFSFQSNNFSNSKMMMRIMHVIGEWCNGTLNLSFHDMINKYNKSTKGFDLKITFK